VTFKSPYGYDRESDNQGVRDCAFVSNFVLVKTLALHRLTEAK